MRKLKELEVSEIFADEARDLIQARERAVQLHGTGDIRASGNEVEEAVRHFLKRLLPKKYHVSHGHLIDANGIVSPQFDVIISDASILPALLKGKDETEYVPASVVYAIGEVKSTYSPPSKDRATGECRNDSIADFSDALKCIDEQMVRPVIKNTAYDGISDDTTMEDIVKNTGIKNYNHLMTFFLSVNSEKFDAKRVRGIFRDRPVAHLPNISVLLGRGIVSYSRYKGRSLEYTVYPEDTADGKSWTFNPMESSPVPERHLAMLYLTLINHLARSRLDPPDLNLMLSKLLVGRRSLLEPLGE